MEEVVGNVQEDESRLGLTDAQLASVTDYNNYLLSQGSDATLDINKNHEFIQCALKIIGEKQEAEFLERLSKKQLLMRDSHGRNLAHYIALFFGTFGLYGFFRGAEECRVGYCFALDADGMTPGHFSVFAGKDYNSNADAFAGNTDLNALNNYGDSVIDLADKIDPEGYGQLFRAISFSYSLEAKDLHFVVARGDLENLQRIIGKDRNVLLNYRDGNQVSLVHIAVKHRRYRVLKWLLEQGANINAIDKDGNLPLHYSVLCFQDSPISKVVSDASSDSKDDCIIRKKIDDLLSKHGQSIQQLLLHHHADVLFTNRLGKRAADLFDEPIRRTFVLYKTMRFFQKNDPGYFDREIPNFRNDLVKTFIDTLLFRGSKEVRKEYDGLANGNGDYTYGTGPKLYRISLHLYYGQNLIKACKAYLEKTCSGMLKTFFNKRLENHHELYLWLIGHFENLLVVDQDDFDNLPEKFKENAAAYILQNIIKGDGGAIKNALHTILVSDSNPNDRMMKALSVLEYVCKEIMALESDLSDSNNTEIAFFYRYQDTGAIGYLCV